MGINNSGAVVGYSMLNGNLPRAFLWQNGIMNDLGNGLAMDINDAGQVIGYGNGSPGFLWQNGVFTPLNFIPFGINNAGQIAGSYFGQAVVWTNGDLLGPGPLPGDSRSWGNAINALGQVVGSSFDPGERRPFVWDWNTGNIIQVGTRSGWAEDINDKGTIVGRGANGAFISYFPEDSYSFDLGLGVDSTAYAINNRGQVVGAGEVPEASTYLLVAIGIAGLCTRRKLRPERRDTQGN